MVAPELRSAESIVQFAPAASLTDAVQQELAELSAAVYPPEQDAEWPGRHIEWAPRQWCALVRDGAGTLVSHAGCLLRQGMLDERPVTIGGVGGVMTHPEARGFGHATLAVGRALEFFSGRSEVDFALLVCTPELFGHYARSGWHPFVGRLIVLQKGRPEDFTFNLPMTHSVGEAASKPAPVSGVLDLVGPPW